MAISNPIAPVILFAYKRPELTLKTLESLMSNELANQSTLYIFCDGPKQNATKADIEAIKMLYEVAEKKKWCETVHVFKAEKNKGLANSVIEGVNMILKSRDSAIIIEDDVLLSKYFLRFMNEALTKYKNEERIGGIGSWNYYTNPKIVKDNYFLKMPDTIAWGVFKRSWEKFEVDANVIKRQLESKKLMNQLNFNGKLTEYEKMLNQQIVGAIDSWGIRWFANFILNDWLAFYPNLPLSKHIGFNTGGTHTVVMDFNRNLKLTNNSLMIKDIPIEENQKAMSQYVSFWKRRHSLPIKIINYLLKYIRLNLV